MKRSNAYPPAKGISRCLLAFLMLFPLPPAAAQKVAAAISSTKADGSASAGNSMWLPPDVDEKVPPVGETACQTRFCGRPSSASWSSYVASIDLRPRNLWRTNRLTNMGKRRRRSGARSITWYRSKKCDQGIWA